MAASAKGLLLDKAMVAWLLGFAAALTACPVRENPGQDEAPPALASKAVRELPQEKRDLIYALHLRRAFGGMKGDLQMFNYLARVWADRLGGPESELFQADTRTPVVPVNPAGVGDLAVDAWELAAVDHHISNVLDRLKAKRERETGQHFPYDDAELKSIMWNLSSSLNPRKLTPYSAMPEENPQRLAVQQEIWKDIEADVRAIQARILREKILN